MKQLFIFPAIKPTYFHDFRFKTQKISKDFVRSKVWYGRENTPLNGYS